MNLLISVFLIPTMYIISIDAGSISGYDTVMVRIFLPHLSERKYFLRLLTKHCKICVLLWKNRKYLKLFFSLLSFLLPQMHFVVCLSIQTSYLFCICLLVVLLVLHSLVQTYWGSLWSRHLFGLIVCLWVLRIVLLLSLFYLILVLLRVWVWMQETQMNLFFFKCSLCCSIDWLATRILLAYIQQWVYVSPLFWWYIGYIPFSYYSQIWF